MVFQKNMVESRGKFFLKIDAAIMHKKRLLHNYEK